MRSGLWYAFGLVTATTAVILWCRLGRLWLVWLFARGD